MKGKLETRKKMRVAIVSKSMDIGGGEMLAARLSTYIDSDKFDVKVFIIEKDQDNQIAKTLKESNVNYVALGCPHKFSFKGYKMFSKALKDFAPDVVHAHLDIAFSWIWTFLHNKPLVFTLHSNPYRWKDKRTSLVIKLKSLQGKLKVIGCAKIISQYAKDCYKLPSKQVGYIYNPIETDIYSKGGAFGNPIKFVHIGRFTAIKNHKLLINAFNRLQQTNKNVQLNLAGQGPLFNQMQDYAKEIGCENINFLGNVENVPQLLSESDVLVLSSKSEACPIVVLEAMASGLPIISTNVGGVPELVTDNGIVVKEGDEDAFTNAMQTLVDNIDLAKQMGEKSLIYSKQYDKDIITRQYELEYLKFSKLEK